MSALLVLSNTPPNRLRGALNFLYAALRGSANKTVHLLTDRYTMADVQAVPLAEVITTDVGEVVMSGIDPV